MESTQSFNAGLLLGGTLVFERPAYTVEEERNAVVCVITTGPLLENSTVVLSTQISSPPSALSRVDCIIILKSNCLTQLCPLYFTQRTVFCLSPAPADYMSVRSTFLMFGPGLPTQRCITIVIEDDTADENTETFDVVLIRLMEAESITAQVFILDNGKYCKQFIIH